MTKGASKKQKTAKEMQVTKKYYLFSSQIIVVKQLYCSLLLLLELPMTGVKTEAEALGYCVF